MRSIPLKGRSCSTVGTSYKRYVRGVSTQMGHVHTTNEGTKGQARSSGATMTYTQAKMGMTE